MDEKTLKATYYQERYFKDTNVCNNLLTKFDYALYKLCIFEASLRKSIPFEIYMIVRDLYYKTGSKKKLSLIESNNKTQSTDSLIRPRREINIEADYIPDHSMFKTCTSHTVKQKDQDFQSFRRQMLQAKYIDETEMSGSFCEFTRFVQQIIHNTNKQLSEEASKRECGIAKRARAAAMSGALTNADETARDPLETSI